MWLHSTPHGRWQGRCLVANGHSATPASASGHGPHPSGPGAIKTWHLHRLLSYAAIPCETVQPRAIVRPHLGHFVRVQGTPRRCPMEAPQLGQTHIPSGPAACPPMRPRPFPVALPRPVPGPRPVGPVPSPRGMRPHPLSHGGNPASNLLEHAAQRLAPLWQCVGQRLAS